MASVLPLSLFCHGTGCPEDVCWSGAVANDVVSLDFVWRSWQKIHVSRELRDTKYDYVPAASGRQREDVAVPPYTGTRTRRQPLAKRRRGPEPTSTDTCGIMGSMGSVKLCALRPIRQTVAGRVLKHLRDFRRCKRSMRAFCSSSAKRGNTTAQHARYSYVSRDCELRCARGLG